MKRNKLTGNENERGGNEERVDKARNRGEKREDMKERIKREG